jgi:type IV pilus assembly protein PilV
MHAMSRKPSRLNRTPAAGAPRSGARGFTLVELLVALAILSIGLLGIGKMLLNASRANDSAYLRSEATALAYQILDAMRANRISATGGAYTIALATPAPNPGVDCSAAACTTATTLAAYDLYQWKQISLPAALGPAALGSVLVVPVVDGLSGATLNQVTVTVQWDDTVAQQALGPTTATPNQVSIVVESVL